MSRTCYVGRGLLSVSLLGTDGGFFPLSGESEVSLVFQEDNESIFDARNGVVEKVDWYVRNYGARLEAQCFRVDPEAFALLLKATYTEFTAGSAVAYTLPASVVEDRDYLLAPNLDPTGLTVKDAVAATVDAGDYVLNEEFGIIKFVDVTGYTQPFTVTAASLGHKQFALHGTDQIFVEAMLKGVNAINEQKVLAHFYRLAVDVSQALRIVQRGFSDLTIQFQCCPDLEATTDPALGNYGKIVFI